MTQDGGARIGNIAGLYHIVRIARETLRPIMEPAEIRSRRAFAHISNRNLVVRLSAREHMFTRDRRNSSGT